MTGSKIIISGYYGFSNAGDEAMLYAIIDSLHSMDPNVQITAISGNPGKTEHRFGVKAIHRFDLFRILRAVWKSDVLISGGGSLLQDVTSQRSTLYYLGVILIGILFRKKVFLYAQGIGPLRKKLTQHIVKLILDHTDAITVRDRASGEFLQRMHVKAPVCVTADAVLSLTPAPDGPGRKILDENRIPRDRKLIGICVRDWPGLEEMADAFGKYIRAVKKDCCVVFIPMQCPDDVNAALRISLPQDGSVYILKDTYDPKTLMSLIGQMDFLVGIRLHALIFAALMHIPFVGISYDPKIDNFLYSIDRHSLFSIYDFDAEKLYDITMKVLKQDPDVETWQSVDRMRAQSRRTAEILRSVIDEKGDK